MMAADDVALLVMVLLLLDPPNALDFLTVPAATLTPISFVLSARMALKPSIWSNKDRAVLHDTWGIYNSKIGVK